MVPEQLGLRDRKREETRSRLETAAVTLVLRDGLDHATVDSISAMADVSSRTFFNYFDSKEDAILGIRDTAITPESVAEHIARTDGADVVESTVALLVGLIRPSIEGAALHESRVEVMKQYPQLFGRHVAQMSRMVDQLVDAATAILDDSTDARDPHGHRVGQASTFERSDAEMLLAVCGSAVRTAVKAWVDTASDATADTVEVRAVALVRTLATRIG